MRPAAQIAAEHKDQLQAIDKKVAALRGATARISRVPSHAAPRGSTTGGTGSSSSSDRRLSSSPHASMATPGGAIGMKPVARIRNIAESARRRSQLLQQQQQPGLSQRQHQASMSSLGVADSGGDWPAGGGRFQQAAARVSKQRGGAGERQSAELESHERGAAADHVAAAERASSHGGHALGGVQSPSRRRKMSAKLKVRRAAPVGMTTSPTDDSPQLKDTRGREGC